MIFIEEFFTDDFYKTDGTFLLEDFEPGDYKISVRAYDLDNVLFAEGSQAKKFLLC